MPTFDWIGKSAVVNHHREVLYRLLLCDKALSAGDAEAGNLLAQGDNLLALKTLLPYYAGKVKCIYIDPPYNTGNENWVYNDNVNSPEIRQWLEKNVGNLAGILTLFLEKTAIFTLRPSCTSSPVRRSDAGTRCGGR